MTINQPKIPPIPGMPKTDKADKPILTNPDFNQLRKDYIKKIRDALLALRNSLDKGRDKEIIMSFTGWINPSQHPDPTRLPFECRTDGRSRHEGKSECLFALVNDLIQTFWEFCINKSPFGVDVVDVKLNIIEQVTQKGLSAFKVEGTAKEGFVLVEK